LKEVGPIEIMHIQKGCMQGTGYKKVPAATTWLNFSSAAKVSHAIGYTFASQAWPETLETKSCKLNHGFCWRKRSTRRIIGQRREEELDETLVKHGREKKFAI
jgi:hypothetical protein